MNASHTGSGAESGSQVQLILVSINLILTFITTLVTSMRFRAKCGCAECNMKPSNSAPSPSDVTKPINAPEQPKTTEQWKELPV